LRTWQRRRGGRHPLARLRRNPFGGGTMGVVANLAVKGATLLGGLMAARALSVAVKKIPGLPAIVTDGKWSPAIVAGALVLGAAFVPRRILPGIVSRYWDEFLLGLGLNAVIQVAAAVLPEGEIRNLVTGAAGLGDVYSSAYRYLPAAGVGSYYQTDGVGLMAAQAGVGLMEAPAGVGAYYQDGPAAGIGSYYETGSVGLMEAPAGLGGGENIPPGGGSTEIGGGRVNQPEGKADSPGGVFGQSIFAGF